MHSVHPITAETLAPGQRPSETSVLEWVGQALIRARYAAQARAALSYTWQGGDPA